MMGAQDLPSWVLFQKGRLAWSQGQWSLAIQHLRDALAKRSVYPEADWYLGRVYFATGELSSAQQHLEAALADAEFLRFPQDRFSILYDYDRLLAVKRGRQNTLERINLLRERILLAKPEEQRFSSGSLETLGDQDRRRFLNAFLEPYVGRNEERRYALDRVLFLFRREVDFTLEALTRLAEIWMLYPAEVGTNPRQAASYALGALVMIFSRTLRELQTTDVDFQFSVLTPTIYPDLPGSPAVTYRQNSLYALFQPALARSGPQRRLALYEPQYSNLVESRTPLLLKILALSLRAWGELADLSIQNQSNWQERLTTVLGSNPNFDETWRLILNQPAPNPITYPEAVKLVQHLFLRERQTCQILYDLFPDTPEGQWALERLRELEGRGGTLVRPVLSR